MALGWLYLYSKYRQTKKRLDDLEAENEGGQMICKNCGYPRFQHAADERETCPIYITEEER